MNHLFEREKMKTVELAPEFLELVSRARMDTDEDWGFIDSRIGNYLTDPYVSWAVSRGMDDLDDGVTDLSCTILAKSDIPLTDEQISFLEGRLEEEEYLPATYWLACALYKRGRKSGLIVDKWQEACKDDSSAGEFARSLIMSKRPKVD